MFENLQKKKPPNPEDLFDVRYSRVRDGTKEEIQLELQIRGLENRHAYINDQRVCMCKYCGRLLVANGVNFASYGGEGLEMNFGTCSKCRKTGKG